MSLKAGRVGVNPADVDPVSGHINSSSMEGYTKAEADDKFLSKSDASNTYETKTDASTALADKQNITLQTPISMLSGTKVTVEAGLQGLNSEKMSYADNGVLGAKNFFNVNDIRTSQASYQKTETGVRIYNDESATFRFVSFWLKNLPKNTKIRATMNVSITSGQAKVFISDRAGSTTTISDESVSDGFYEVTFNTGNYEQLSVSLYSTTSTSEIGDVIYSDVMFTLATDPDSTYQPYAMTNRDLTEFKLKLDLNLLNASSFSDFQNRMNS